MACSSGLPVGVVDVRVQAELRAKYDNLNKQKNDLFTGERSGLLLENVEILTEDNCKDPEVIDLFKDVLKLYLAVINLHTSANSVWLNSTQDDDLGSETAWLFTQNVVNLRDEIQPVHDKIQAKAKEFSITILSD